MSKDLKELLQGFPYEIRNPGSFSSEESLMKAEVSAVVSDERKLTDGCLFICCRITNHNGSNVIGKAIEAGASFIVTEQGLYDDALGASGKSEAEFLGDDPPAVITAPDTRYAMAFIYAAWHGHPADQLTIIGITGTKGKTTVTHMLYSILKEAGQKVGVIGSLETIIGEVHETSSMTTPEADVLQAKLADMVKAGTETAVIETSSIALMSHRTQGFIFDIAVFTNISEDHIGEGEHESFEDYLRAKSMMMRQCLNGIVNSEDPYCRQILEGHTCEIKSYGLSSDPELRASNINCFFNDGMPAVEFDTAGLSEMHITVSMPGEFTVCNALAAARAAMCLGISEDVIVKGLSKVRVDGRIDLVRPPENNGHDLPSVIVDYAHNELSVRTLIDTMRLYYTGRIICVLGVARLASRGPGLGRASAEHADFTVATTDSTYGEDPAVFLDSLVSGIEKAKGDYAVIRGRKEAIEYAISHADPDDLVIIAGRGNVTGLESDDGYHILPCDKDLVMDIFEGKLKRQ